MKNNIVRFLQAKKISYKAIETSPEKRSAVETAAILEVSPELVFKSIVVLRPLKGKPILAIIPGPSSLDLKKLAKILNEKKLLLSSHKEAEQITGLQTGGISPLALLNKGFQFVMDEVCLTHESIWISGGQRGLTIEIAARDLVSLINPKLANIT